MSMPMSAELAALLQPKSARQRRPALVVGLATSHHEIEAAQRLRYQVFVEEMGARLDSDIFGIERDRFDPYCQHLVVRNSTDNTVVGSYRILTDTQALNAGGYYSQTEFDLTRVLAMPGRFMEIGRTCVHPDFRTGATIALLWGGLARFMIANRFDYLMGCASIPLNGSTETASAIYQYLARTHLSPGLWRTFPKVPLPRIAVGATANLVIPALIKAYLRAGAQICGEPAWDPHFNVADLFMLLRADAINARYARHFFNRIN